MSFSISAKLCPLYTSSKLSKSRQPRSAGARSGLTLVEMIVVVFILAILVGLVLPRVTGLTGQASSSTNANILSDVNRAVGLHEARYGKLPNTWDYLIGQDGTSAYGKLHPNVVALLQAAPITLTADQARSLTEAGFIGGHLNDDAFTGLPSNSQRSWRPVATGRSVLAIQKPATFGGHGVDWLDRAFNVNQFKDSFNDEYVVFGLSGATNMKGNSLQEIPTVQSADPEKYYANVLVVYRVPGAGRPYFKAQYMGCFCPDGTSIRDNLDSYSTADVPVN